MNLPADFAIEGAGLFPDRIGLRRVVVREGMIDAGGAADTVWRLAPQQLLIPAFHDHHTHLVATHRPPQGPDLHGCAARREAIERVAAWLAAHPGTAPVLGEGWDESAWDDPRPLTRADLDPLAPVRAVALRRVCGHRAVANGAAWEILSPSGVEADPRTGTLLESLALGLPARWPAPTEDYSAGARRGQAAAARHGVTAIDEMGRLETYDALRAMEEAGELFLAVRHYFPLAQAGDLIARGLVPGGSQGGVRIAGLKAFLDGSLGARTAAVGAAYADAPGSGMLLWEMEPLADAVRAGARAGFAVALHAIGGRAVAQALDVFERVRAAAVDPDLLLRIEHAEEIDDGLLARARAARVALSMQPNFTARWQGAGGMYERALGSERRTALNRYRSAAASTRVLFGSDTMPFGPLEGLPGALDHPDPRERLSLVEALHAYAAGGIDPAPPADLLGSGRAADLVVLEAPDDPETALRSRRARAVWTAAAGRVVWCDPASGAPESLRGVGA